MEKEEILENIIKKYDLQKRQSINYEFFSKIYQEYANQMTEQELANLLQITTKQFGSFRSKAKKNENSNVWILINRNLSNQQKGQKLLELAQLYNLHKFQKIDYPFFVEMHQQVKTWLTENEFAQLLGVCDSKLSRVRKRRHDKNIRSSKIR